MDIHSKLITELNRGSYKAFDELYRLYSDLLYGFILNITKSPSISEDILQETFIKIWINREKISPDYSFKAYLFKISKNSIINSFRKQVNNVDFEEYVCSNQFKGSIEPNDIEKKIYFDEFMVSLELVKQELTERQKEIFELSKEHAMTIDEIAVILKISNQTVKNQLSIALKTVRQKLPNHSFFLQLFF